MNTSTSKTTKAALPTGKQMNGNSTNGTNGGGGMAVWTIIVRSLAVIGIVALVSVGMDLSVRVSVIEASRFTSRDGASLRSQVAEDMKELRDLVNTVPDWLRESVREMKDTQKEILLRLRTIEKQQK